jgi:hypothetical protein
MISDTDLLQANATLIAGILIFLTIAPLSSNVIAQIIEKRVVIWSVYATIVILLASTWTVFFPTGSYQDSLSIAKVLTLGGIIGILAAISITLGGIPRIQRRQKGPS